MADTCDRKTRYRAKKFQDGEPTWKVEIGSLGTPEKGNKRYGRRDGAHLLPNGKTKTTKLKKKYLPNLDKK